MEGDAYKHQERLLNARTFGLALFLHVALFVVIWLCGIILTPTPEVVIPIDLTIVPPWAEQTNDPDPDPNPPPKPEPPKPKPKIKQQVKPKPKVEETKQDAVIKEKPKPKKPEVKKGDFLKDAKLIKKKPPPDFRKDAKLIKAPPTTRTGKATANEKPMSEADYLKYLNQGYKIGTRNQLAPNEASRCAFLISKALKSKWEFNWHEGLAPIHLQVTFGPGGTLLNCKIVQTSGDPEVDKSVLTAARLVNRVPGLSPDFIKQFSSTPYVILMKPMRQ